LPLQIILADNQVIFRTGVARVLATERDLNVVAQCATMDELREAVGRVRRSIVVFPSSMAADLVPLLDTIEKAGSRCVMILEHEAVMDPALAKRVQGIVLRSVAGPQLVDCLHRVAAGERSVQRAMVKTMPSPDHVGLSVLAALTPKELQIVSLVAEGGKNRDIATQLGTKEQVIKNYLRSIYDKTGVSDRLELALFTIHHRALNEAVERVRATLVRSA
jgi:DNA-binding NarL/FixJ family response regulator